MADTNDNAKLSAKEMDLKDMRLSPDEFLYYTGINLDFRLVEKNIADGNPSNASQAFIDRIQRRLNAYIDSHFHGWISQGGPKPTDRQKYWYKMAVVEQVLYVFSNTAITEDMGLDSNGYVRLTRQQVLSHELGVETVRDLELAGLYDRSLNSGVGFAYCWWRI